jgi:N-acetylmuramic acid 6-phosphate etherase
LKEKLHQLLTEQVNANTNTIDALSAIDIVRLIHEEDKAVFSAVQNTLEDVSQAISVVELQLAKGGRMFYGGAGTSGRLGVLDASECPPTFNVPPELFQGIIAGGDTALRRAVEGAEDNAERGATELREAGFRAGDVFCGIAASGRTPWVLGAVAEAKRLGGRTIGISCTPQATLSAQVEVAIELLTGPEVVTGSTRLKAGTATKMVLNMISTGALIRLGYVFGNLMVNVQPTNEKLVDRATRIIAAAGKVDEARAAELLMESGSTVRTAIVMARLNTDRVKAEALLARHRNRVSDVLAEAGIPPAKRSE